MRLYILLLLTVYINTNIYSQIKPKITTNQISNLLVDSTRLENDSILVYYQNGIVIGRDTISGTGGSVVGVTGSGTTNEIAYFTGATTLGSLATSTYPSLTELSYVKGVTSAIQTQLNGKQATLTNPVTGTGTTNYLPKFTGSSTIGNSLVYDNGTNVGIGITNPLNRLHIRSTGSADTYQLLLESDSETTGSRAGINIATVKSTGGVISPFLRFDLGSNYTTKTHSASFGIYGNNADGGFTEYMWIGVANKDSYNNAAMKIDSLGRVGINILTTNLPTSTLDVNGNTNITGKLLLNDATSSIYVGSNNATTATTAYSNLGVGNNALLSLTTGDDNIAIGTDASYTLTTGIQNISIGKGAATGATSSINNIAIGNLALNVSNGESNVGIGTLALGSATTGNNNIAIGHSAGQNHSSATESIYIGKSTTGTTSATNEVVIGSNAAGQGTNTTVINSTSTVRTTIQGDTLVVPKFLNVDTATLYVDATNNRVGIGTSTPRTVLDVESETGGVRFKIEYNQNAENGGLNFIDSDDTTSFFRIISGTNTDSRFIPSMEFIRGSGQTQVGGANAFFISSIDSTNLDILNSNYGVFAIQAQNTNGGQLINANLFSVNNSGTPVFMIEASGDVGIGTTSPQADLQINNMNATGGIDTMLIINGENGKVYINDYGDILNEAGTTKTGFSAAYTSNTGGFGTTSNSNMTIYTNSIRRINITSGGDVGIGTTTPGYQLHVNGSVAGVGAYNNLSDVNWKKNINDLSYGLDKLLQLRPITFNWLNEQYGDRLNTGFIAQEIEDILPDMVTTANDGVKSLATTDLIPLLVKSIQEQQTIIESQASEIETLKTQYNDLLQRIINLENN